MTWKSLMKKLSFIKFHRAVFRWTIIATIVVGILAWIVHFTYDDRNDVYKPSQLRYIVNDLDTHSKQLVICTDIDDTAEYNSYISKYFKHIDSGNYINFKFAELFICDTVAYLRNTSKNLAEVVVAYKSKSRSEKVYLHPVFLSKQRRCPLLHKPKSNLRYPDLF